jgi:ABC-2 type transport system ATP-binding protein
LPLNYRRLVTIQLNNAGKRFRYDWIFKNLSTEFRPANRYALLGPNGSGKSTLMKVLSGHLSLSKGTITHALNGKTIDPDHLYRQVSYAAPYIELIEELTLTESLYFHTQLRPLRSGMNADDLYNLLELPRALNKELRFFSSGMKQRVRLALAICSDTPLLLLDEPTTNLDVQGIMWFHHVLEQHASNRLVIIASNDASDVERCNEHLHINNWK